MTRPLLIVCAGTLLAMVGLWMAYPPLALILPGVVLVAGGLLVDFGE